MAIDIIECLVGIDFHGPTRREKIYVYIFLKKKLLVSFCANSLNAISVLLKPTSLNRPPDKVHKKWPELVGISKG